MTQKNKIVSSTMLIMSLMLFSRLVGFIRESVIAATYGVSAQTDAYFLALSIVSLSFTLIGTSCISVVFQPLYTKIDVTVGHEMSDQFASRTICFFLLLSTALVAIVLLVAPFFVRLMAPDFTPEQSILTTQMVRLFSISSILTSASYISSSILNSKRKFTWPQLIGLPGSVCIIFSCLLFSGHFGIQPLIISTAIGSILQGILIFLVARKSVRFKMDLSFRDSNLRLLLLLAIPTFIGTAAADINIVVDRVLAAGLGEGGISGISFATKLSGLINGLFSVAILTAVFPDLSEHSAKGDNEAFADILRKSLSFIVFALTPISAVAICFNREIVQMVFERGAFDANATALTANVFACFSIGLLFIAARDILSRGLYAMQDSRTPMINGIVAVALNIMLSLALVQILAAQGIALANSISAVLSCILMALSLRKKISKLIDRRLLSSIVRIFLATGGMLAVMYVARSAISFLPLWTMMITLLIFGVSVYVGLCSVLRLDEILFVWKMLRGTRG